jgi:beta-galactosidase
VTAAVIAAAPVWAEDAPRTRESFDAGWRFTRGDPADAGHRLAYENLKPWIVATGSDLVGADRPKPVRPEGSPGGDISYVRPGFDDSGWRQLDLPHDWGIEGPFSQDLPGDTGKLPWAGVGWYRKHFTMPAGDSTREIFLDIDGAMAYSEVWLNGQFIGGWPYGYTSFRLELTPYLKFGEQNVLAIRLDNPPDSSRWYPGSGLYRHVWLVKAAPVRVTHWGTFVTTPRITAEEAMVNVDFEVEDQTADKVALEVTTRVFELGPDNTRGAEPVAISAPVHVEIDPWRAREAMRSNLLTVSHPKLWDLQHPQRYVAVTTVASGGKVVDEYSTPFGIRTIAFDPDRGFLLNGRHVPIQGVCDHHDLGALGTAINTRALERQLQLLQSMGCNAIRTSHNPPAPELLELCDKLGMLVMDEAFDCWHSGKKLAAGSHRDDLHPAYNDYAKVFDDWHERDLRALVRRDRNHPCVILWSIGNEVIEQHTTDGWKYAEALAAIVRQEDRTRPVTSAFNNLQSGYDGFQTAVDVVGFNYKPEEYPRFHAAHPTMAVFGSETASCVSSRGEYFFPVSDNKAEGRADFQVSSYDLYAPRWAFPPDVEFKGLDEAPFAAGEFVWTGFDYLGEPTPYNADVTNLLNFTDPAEQAKMAQELKELGKIRVPSRSSYFGIIDLAGFPKDRYYIYQARWRPDFPMAHILPHWNWPDRVGQVTPVMVYTSGDEAELFLNGKSLGRRKKGPLEYRLRWDEVKYEPGELQVVAYKDGRKWAEDVMRTTGPAARVLLQADRAVLKADGQDLSFITVTIADKDGLLVPRSKNHVKFTIAGPGEIAAVDNGDATSFEPFQASERDAYNGLALVIVRTKAGEPGTIRLTAQSDGLAPAEITLTSAIP